MQTIKTQVQALVWQLIPQLAVTPTATISATPSTNGSSQSSIRAPVLSPPSVPMSAPYDFYRWDRIGEGRGDIGGGFAPSSMVPVAGVYRPQFPGIGGGDLHPSFPGVIPQPRGDQGQGSLVGPDHPLFKTPDYGNPDPYGRQSQYDPTCPPGWPQGMPRPRFDSFMPVPGPNGPDFGMPGGFGGGGQGRGVGLPGRRRVPGEPNPDHFRPPGDGDNRFT